MQEQLEIYLLRANYARNTIYISRFEIYKSAKYIKIYIEFSILNIINNKLKRKELREL